MLVVCDVQTLNAALRNFTVKFDILQQN